jgi:hypothetical protein
MPDRKKPKLGKFAPVTILEIKNFNMKKNLDHSALIADNSPAQLVRI